MVAVILMRALRRDISRYNNVDEEDDGAQDDFGWKLVHADVFRPPPHRMLLSILLGTGTQILCMLTATIAFALLGFLSPSNRGSLGTMALLFYTFFSTISGFVSAVMYKTYNGEEKKKNLFLTATLFPGGVFGILLLLNFILISNESSAAVPFGTLFTLVALWFLISIPLCILGSYLGYKRNLFKSPVRTNQIPRQIPNQVGSLLI
jgi:transmembrane 9 superfamily protein 2/4